MKHLTENEFVTLYYDRDDGPEIQQFKTHVAACSQCQNGFKRVSAFLDRLHIPVPEPPEDYERQVWRRLQPRLPVQTSGGRFRWFRQSEWVAAVAVTAVVLLAFLVGRWFERSVETDRSKAVAHIAPTEPSRIAARDRALLLAVGGHLERVQMMLTELTNASRAPQIDISTEQDTARTLLPDNRLYRETATQLADAQIESLLDELERLLLDLSHHPSVVSVSELDDFRDRIEKQGILFKVRIAGSQLRARQGITGL
jgi:hypothetical protein